MSFLLRDIKLILMLYCNIKRVSLFVEYGVTVKGCDPEKLTGEPPEKPYSITNACYKKEKKRNASVTPHFYKPFAINHTIMVFYQVREH